jgi:hypothetical protein
MTDQAFSIVVFPFLKTSGPVQIGGHTFRSTTDVAGLPIEQANAVGEIALMLFVQSDLRVKSASYAIVPYIDFNESGAQLDQLMHLRAVISYIYAAPHDIFESLFLTPEATSLVIFSPGDVSVFLVRPRHHTESVSSVAGPSPDARHTLPGYAGLYNFRHPFWVEPGSRLYGPKPHITLNIQQDLRIDIEIRLTGRPDYSLLLALLNGPITPTARRIYLALHWFNAANEDAADPDRALLSLAVAFEALLRLPDSSKTDRLVDAITLLLGRTERLDDWAQQFYAARSRVAHEGHVGDRYYYIPQSSKQKQASGLFGSLILYGRQIFQLCLGTLLVGADLAERANLQEKFVTNNERFEKICRSLDASSSSPSARLSAIESTVRALEHYQFVPSGEVSKATMIAAVRRAAATLLNCGGPSAQTVIDALTKIAAAKREDGEFAELAAIEELHATFEKYELANLTTEERIVRDLVEIAWMSLFQYYYWLKERKGMEEGRKAE